MRCTEKDLELFRQHCGNVEDVECSMYDAIHFMMAHLNWYKPGCFPRLEHMTEQNVDSTDQSNWIVELSHKTIKNLIREIVESSTLVTLTLRELNEVSIVLGQFIKQEPWLKSVIDTIQAIIDNATIRKVATVAFDTYSKNEVERLVLEISKDAAEFIRENGIKRYSR